MKQCPKCGGIFEPTMGFCPTDGGVLIEAPAAPEPPKRKTDPGLGTVRDPQAAQKAPDSLAAWGLEPSGPVITSADAVASGTMSGSGRVRVALPGPSPTFAPVGFVPVAEGSAAAAGAPIIQVGPPLPAAPPPAQPFPAISAPLQPGPSGVVPQAVSQPVARPFPQMVAPPMAPAPVAVAAPMMPAAPPMMPAAPPMMPAAPPMAPAAPPPAHLAQPMQPPAHMARPMPLPASHPPASSLQPPASADDSLEYQIPKSGGGKGLIIAAVVIVILGGLGGGVWYFLSRGAAAISAALSDAGMALTVRFDAAPLAAPQADAGAADTAVAIIPIPELEAKPATPEPKPEPKAKAPEPKPEPKAKAPAPKPEPKAKAPTPKPEPKGKGKKKKLDSSSVLDPFK